MTTPAYYHEYNMRRRPLRPAAHAALLALADEPLVSCRHLFRRRSQVALPGADEWQRKAIDALCERGLARTSGLRGPFGARIVVITDRGRRKAAELAATAPANAPIAALPELAAAAG